MHARLLLLLLFLAGALSARAQIFVNNPNTASFGFFSSFDGPIDHNTSPNYWNGGTPGIATSSDGGYGYGYGTAPLSEGVTFSVTGYISPDGQAELYFGSSVNTLNFTVGSFVAMLKLSPLEPDLRLTGFTTDSQKLSHTQDVNYVTAVIDADTGYLTLTPNQSFSLNPGQSYALGGTFQTAAIPEPATVALGFGLAAGLIAAWRRRAANRPPSPPGPC